jgi:intein-encoded DNA endonuclease-like protein
METQETSRLDSYALAKRDKFHPTPRKHRTLEVQLLLNAEVLELHKKSLPYSKIIEEMRLRHSVKLAKSSISGWVNGKHTPLGRAHSFDSKGSPELAYIIGVESGDGSLNFKRYNYRVRLNAIDKDFVLEFDRCLSKVLNAPRHKTWKGSGANEFFQLEVSSYLLYRFLRRPLAILTPWIETDSDCVAGFLRGFFDSEGSVSETGVVTASNTNLDLLRYVCELLRKYFGIVATAPRLTTKKGSLLVRRGRAYVRKSDCYSIRLPMAYVLTYYRKVGFAIRRKSLRLERALSIKISKTRFDKLK